MFLERKRLLNQHTMTWNFFCILFQVSLFCPAYLVYILLCFRLSVYWYVCVSELYPTIVCMCVWFKKNQQLMGRELLYKEKEKEEWELKCLLLHDFVTRAKFSEENHEWMNAPTSGQPTKQPFTLEETHVAKHSITILPSTLYTTERDKGKLDSNSIRHDVAPKDIIFVWQIYLL